MSIKQASGIFPICGLQAPWLRKTDSGGGYLGSPGPVSQGLWRGLGVPADSLWAGGGRQQTLGVGWRVGCTQEAAGPLVLVALTQSCFCLSLLPLQVMPAGHTDHTGKENRGGRGSGEARRGLTTQAHGDPRKDLQVEVCHRTGAPRSHRTLARPPEGGVHVLTAWGGGPWRIPVRDAQTPSPPCRAAGGRATL